MGIFSSIKDAIFGHKAAPATPTGTPPTSATTIGGTTTAAPAPQPMQEVDVERQLDAMAGADKLNWRTSIVDLMKLIGVDSDYASRKELAGEMGKTDYSGDASENIWLHQRVMQELSKNGGKV
ncbi:MAG: DUF3597 domain-containing protein, partial [Croceibacterium sp.]